MDDESRTSLCKGSERENEKETGQIRSVELPGKAQRVFSFFHSLCLFPLKMDPLQASIVTDHRRRQITRLKKRGKDQGTQSRHTWNGEEKANKSCYQTCLVLWAVTHDMGVRKFIHKDIPLTAHHTDKKTPHKACRLT